MEAQDYSIQNIEYKPIPMSQLSSIVWAAQSSVTQVETLDYYCVAHDDPAYQAFLKGVDPDEEALKPYHFWFDQVKATVQRGIKVTRIHLLPDALTDYLNYEIEFGYRKWCIPSGEEVRILKKSSNLELSSMAFRDFYVIDDSRVIVPVYDSGNMYIDLNEVSNARGVDYFVMVKNRLLKKSAPLPIAGSIW